jgi:hypothetical protein
MNFEELRSGAKFTGQDFNRLIGLSHITGNTAVLKSLASFVEAGMIPQILNPDPLQPYPTNNDFQGDFCLGNGAKFMPRIPVDSLTKHFLSSGSTGAGKTNQGFYYMSQFVQLKKKFMHLGFKQGTRHFSRHIPILILIAGPTANFSWSILDAPPGVSQIVWDNAVVKLFCESQYIAEAGQSLMLSCLT